MAARRTSGAGDAGTSMTISQLAESVGMSVRNIRAHQSRGLLPPPERRGRVAYYDSRHVVTLRRIKELQDRRYNLAAIAELLASGADDETVLQRLVLAPLLDPDELQISWVALAGLYGQRPNPANRERALAAGLVREAPDGEFIAPSRRLLDAARQLVEMGVPFQPMFDLQVEVAHATRDIARRFVEMCLECAVEPHAGGTVPPEKWNAVLERFEQLRRQMASVLAATFSVNVRLATESILAERASAS